MNDSKHIIQKLFVQIDTSNVKEANNIKNNVDLFLKNEILPEIEKLLVKYDSPKIVSRVENLKLQISISDWNKKAELKSRIITEFEKQLQLVLKSGNLGSTPRPLSNKVTETENDENIFLFFLENGHLPWFGKEEQIARFERTVLDGKFRFSDSFTNKTKAVLSNSEEAVDRLNNQFSERFVVVFLTLINAGLNNKESAILTVLKNSKRSFNREWLRVLFTISLEQNVEGSIDAVQIWFQFLKKAPSGFIKKDKKEISEIFKLFLAAIPDKILSDSTFQGILNQSLALVSMKQSMPESVEKIIIQKKKTEEKESFPEEKQSEIAVQNAGLVLLHPFYKSFFNELKITDANGKIKTGKHDLAVHLLHFLATKKENVFEANLVLEKFLCDISFKKTIQRKSLLSLKMKEEANNLLGQVIKFWPELKSTSPDGLRQMFLQRDGKLLQNERNFKLIVERKAQDILLEKLNWNLSLIEIPWIKKLIYVEW